MSAIIEVDFNNTYLIKQTYSQSLNGRPNSNPNRQMALGPGICWPGGIDLTIGTSTNQDRIQGFYSNFYIEESRIRGDFNAVSIDKGVRAFLDDPFPLQQHRFNTLIYSGIYNSRTGINNTNVFSTGTDITKSLDPENGSIQRTLAEDTNMIVFQENKISRALIDKDTIYTTESGTQTQSGAAVIGQFVPYKGVYGISKNPESLAIYGYRKYFSDRNRNAILRLSNDGLTEISAYGMEDYFRDELAKVKDTNTAYSIPATGSVPVTSGGGIGDFTATCDFTDITPLPSTGMSIKTQAGYITQVEILSAPTSIKIYYSQAFTAVLTNKMIFEYSENGKVKGGWDVHNRNYIVSLQETPLLKSKTENFQTLAFDDKINGWVSFYTYKPETIFSVKNNYFTTQEVGLFKHYSEIANTRNTFYGVSNPSTITCVFNVQPSLVKNFKTVGYEGSSGWEVESFVSDFTGVNQLPAGTYVENQDQTLSVKSYEEGKYVDPTTGQTLNAGFNRKENIYVANIVSNSTAMPNEVSFGNHITGIRGFVATVKFKTDDTTQLGGTKQLWSTRSEYVNSTGF